jgi:hypothetical protein
MKPRTLWLTYLAGDGADVIRYRDDWCRQQFQLTMEKVREAASDV